MPQVVLVGGGHAHLHTLRQATTLIRAGAEVTLVGPQTHHYYSGMGPGLLGGTYRPQEARIAVERLVLSRGGRFVRGRVKRVDAAQRHLVLDDDSSIPYDLVSFNTGSRVPAEQLGASDDHVITVKPVENLARTRGLFLSRRWDGGNRILVVGGGAAGVELAANLAKLARENSLPLRITLIDQEPRLLARMAKRAGRIAQGVLAGYGIDILPGRRLITVQEGRALDDKGETHPFDFAFLTTGIVPDRLYAESGLPTAEDGGLRVDHHLQAIGFPGMFGGGDCVSLAPVGLPRIGVYAVRQGPVLLRNLLASLRNQPLAEFHPQRRYLLILNLGDGTGLVVWGKWAWRGRLGFRWKDYLDRSFMGRFQRCGELQEEDTR